MWGRSLWTEDRGSKTAARSQSWQELVAFRRAAAHGIFVGVACLLAGVLL
jgi:hypothetical protein